MEFQFHKYVFIFLILLCHEVLVMEGRVLKSMYRTESKQSVPTPKSQGRGFGDSGAVEGEEDLPPTTPGDSPGIGHPLEQDKEDGHEIVGIKHPVMDLPGDSPGVGHYLADKELKSHRIDDFRPTSPGSNYSHVQVKDENGQKSARHSFSDTDDFKPTNPGHSPGVGHPLEQEKEDGELQGTKHSVMGSTDDFRHTTPGNSPGVGHFPAGKEQKAPSTDDFRPTMLGNSPGVGRYSHVQDTEEKEQKSEGHSFSETDDFKPTNPGHSPGVGHSDRN
ncbi:hypothetical protein SLE2022_362150 [Rubroshorea leprosula]